tara:strand:- start:406494 stop:407246 length:753 start_codon:yes stop_codon:yes gene_type:complete
METKLTITKMKTTLHKAENRGFANHGWLQANHSFSFANYYDPEKVHFGALRVLNDDIIAPKMGFGTHPHNNMEIVTIPLSGVLKHRDSMNNTWEFVLPGEVQVMSAGTGVEHAELNGSEEDYLSLFQLWILPSKQQVAPRYDQKKFDAAGRKNKLQLLVTSFNDKDKESLKIYQEATLSRIDLDSDRTFTYSLKNKNNGVYMMNIQGEITVEGNELNGRDAIAISNTKSFTMSAQESSELLFIEVPMINL